MLAQYDAGYGKGTAAGLGRGALSCIPHRRRYERQVKMASGYLRLRGEKWYACWKDAEGRSRSRAVSKDKAVAGQFLAAQKLKVLLSEAAGTAEVTYVQVA